MPECSGEDYVTRLRETCRAHFCAAGWLVDASLSLEHAAQTRDEDDDAMLARFGDICPADEGQQVMQFVSDRDFLLDRAEAHRRKAITLRTNGQRLLEVITDIVSSGGTEEVAIGMVDALAARLSPYVIAIGRASDEIALIATSLAGTPLAEDREWDQSFEEFAAALRFLAAEAALFDALVDDDFEDR